MSSVKQRLSAVRGPRFAFRSIRALTLSIILTAVCGLLTADLFAKDIPAKPNTLVNDYTGVLSSEQRNALEHKLVAYYDSTSTQIAIVIESSLDGDDLFDYCQRLAEGWGIGEKGKNNGVLIYVAVDDHKARIHVGYGMEATITDAMSTRIRTEQLNPNFKAGDFYTGLDDASTTIIQLASGEYVNDHPRKVEKEKPFSWGTAIFIAVVVLIFLSRGGRGGGRGGRRSSGWGGPVFWGTFGSGGFSGGSGGGGFGGGGFGGGGSGGSW